MKTLGLVDDGALIQLTPRGVQHLVFGAGDAEIPSSAGKLRDGMDVRAEGAYIVVEPSRIEDKPYTWKVSAHHLDRDPDLVPAPLLGLFLTPVSDIEPKL
jgi:hypothetical protein